MGKYKVLNGPPWGGATCRIYHRANIGVQLLEEICGFYSARRQGCVQQANGQPNKPGWPQKNKKRTATLSESILSRGWEKTTT